MEEVAHKAVALCPVIAEDAMVMGAERRVACELEPARCADAHVPGDQHAPCQRPGRVERRRPSGQDAGFFPGARPPAPSGLESERRHCARCPARRAILAASTSPRAAAGESSSETRSLPEWHVARRPSPLQALIQERGSRSPRPRLVPARPAHAHAPASRPGIRPDGLFCHLRVRSSEGVIHRAAANTSHAIRASPRREARPAVRLEAN
jgi:hypothetical protein